MKNESGSGEIVRNKPVKNRALEYKAGLKSDSSLARNKFPVSEYQREYEQKKFSIADSPLLNAEKIVFDSHTNIPRFVRDKVPRKTEYQSKFAETRRVARKEKRISGSRNDICVVTPSLLLSWQFMVSTFSICIYICNKYECKEF